MTSLLALGAASVVQAAGAGGQWAERVQVIYDAGSGTVSRHLLRAWDSEPERDLEFTWEPEPGTPFRPLAGGTIDGSGKLVWRIRGSAAHDRRSVYSTYTGEVRDGRPNGHGRLERRDGEVYEGEWTDGVLNGKGSHLDADGNRYTGDFVGGLPHGSGRQAMADGTIYEGGFSRGRRHGAATLKLPGGTAMATAWRDGLKVSGDSPNRLADALVGGLLRAQAGGGDAGKIDLSVTVDERLNQQASIQYQHVVLDDRVEIYPLNAGMVDYWVGEAPIVDYGYEGTFDYIDWDDAPSFLQVAFKTADGSRVRLDRLELQVDDSQIYRKPFLSAVGHHGCVGYRPGFSLQNNGWGEVSGAALSFEFYNVENPDKASRTFSVDVGNFDEGTDISVDAMLAEAGVDTNALAERRFTCESEGQLPQCRQEVVRSIDLGELAPLIAEESTTGYPAALELGVRGRLRYQWADDRGNSYDAEERLEVALQLAIIETEMMVAEGGDGWGASPEALRYQVVELPEDAQDYAIDLPVRGNKNLAAYIARLKVFAGQSSIHRFRAVAAFEDGSVRQSLPVSYFHIRPRPTFYEPPEPAGGCSLDASYTPPRKSG